MLDYSSHETANEQLLHPGSRKLFSHWEALRAERPYPAREDFSFAGIKEWIPDMVVVERDAFRDTFRYRLAGGRVCALFCDNLTGQNILSPWQGPDRKALQQHLEIAIGEFQPVVIRMKLITDNDQVVAAELMLLPVQARESQNIQLIGGLFTFRSLKNLSHKCIVRHELVSARSIWTEFRKGSSTGLAPYRETRPQPLMRSFTVISGGKP